MKEPESQKKAFQAGYDEASEDLRFMSREACVKKAKLDYPNDWEPSSMEAYKHAKGYYARLDQE